jgi:hypothetical protein
MARLTRTKPRKLRGFTIYKTLVMKAAQISNINRAISDHIVSALTRLYKMAGVGDDRLELGNHTITYSDGAEYEIDAIEVHFANINPELIFHQTELDGDVRTDYSAEYPVTILGIEKMTELLEAVEKVVEGYDNAEFKLPVM